VAEDASVCGLRKSRDVNQPVNLSSLQLARKVVLSGGVPLVGPQEETNKQTNKQTN